MTTKSRNNLNFTKIGNSWQESLMPLGMLILILPIILYNYQCDTATTADLDLPLGFDSLLGTENLCKQRKQDFDSKFKQVIQLSATENHRKTHPVTCVGIPAASSYPSQSPSHLQLLLNSLTWGHTTYRWVQQVLASWSLRFKKKKSYLLNLPQ